MTSTVCRKAPCQKSTAYILLLSGLLMTALFAIVGSGPLAYADTNNDPSAVVKSTVDQAIQVLKQRELSQSARRAKLIDLVQGHFAFDDMSRSALGYHWKELSSQQRQQFVPLFQAFLEDAYLTKIDKYSGQQVRFLGKSSDGNGGAEVKTDVAPQEGGQPVSIVYLLKLENGEWRVYDVAVDNISITANYRNQFNRVINNQGFDALIGEMQDKQQELLASLGK
jgi:phospholipid transport system substrate-binding protein